MQSVKMARMDELETWVNEEGELFITQENPGMDCSVILIPKDYIQQFLSALNEVIGER